MFIIVGLELVGPSKRNLAGVVIEYFFAVGYDTFSNIGMLIYNWGKPDCPHKNQ
jgi:hypothetical protein